MAKEYDKRKDEAMPIHATKDGDWEDFLPLGLKLLGVTSLVKDIRFLKNKVEKLKK